jgi:hypothetical protein
MNMISTGAFQTEMDASNKQPTLAEKFAAVWEKKNAKAARAGGVSLMALSLAACGSDDTTTTATTTTTTTTTPSTPTTQSFTLTSAADTFTGGDGADTFTSARANYGLTDTLTGGLGADVLNIVDEGTTAWTLPNTQTSGIETINLRNLSATDATAATTETTVVDLGAFQGGQYITIGDKTYIATATTSAADAATALVAGTTYDPTGYTLTKTGAEQVTVTATTAGDKADVLVSGNVFTNAPQTNVITVATAGADNGADLQLITMNINGTSVTTGTFAVNASKAIQATAMVDAINAHIGSQVAFSVDDQLHIVSDTAISIASIVSTAAGTASTTPLVTTNVAGASKYTIEDGTAAASGATVKFTLNGVEYTTAATGGSTDADTVAVLVDKINSVYGATIASASGDDLVVDTKGVGIALGNFAQGSGTTFVVGTENLNTTGIGLTVTDAPVVVNNDGVDATSAANYAQTIDATNFVDATDFVSDRSLGDLTINNMVDGQAVGINGLSGITAGAVTANYKATATASEINVSGGVSADTGTDVTVTGTKVASATITSSGGALSTSVNSLDVVTLGSATTAVTIDADTNLSLGAGTTGDQEALTGVAASTVLTVKGTATSVDLETLDADILTVDASGLTGGISAEVVSGAAATFTLKGGQGADTIISTGLATTVAGSIDGGAGTDTLQLQNDTVFDTAAERALYTNFETLSIIDDNDGGTETFDVKGEFTGLKIGAITAGDGITVKGMSSAMAGNVTITGDQAAGATFVLKDSTGTADSLNITLANATATSSADMASSTMVGFETLNVVSSSGNVDETNAAANVVSFAGSGADKLTAINLTGAYAADVVLDNITKAVTLDASGLSGTAALNSEGEVVKGSKVIGSANGDTVETALANVAGSSGDFVTYELGAGADAIATKLAGVNNSNNSLASLKIDGGAGKDTVTFNAADATFVDSVFQHITNVETVTLAQDTANLSFTAGGYFDTNFASAVTLNAIGTSGINNDVAVALDLGSYTGNATVNLTSVGDGDAATDDDLAVTTGSGADTVTVTATSWVGGANKSEALITTNAGDDTITFDSGTIVSATVWGATINAGKGADTIDITGVARSTAAETNAVKFVVAAGDSTSAARDTIKGFMNGDGTNYGDTIDLAAVTIRGDTAGTNGTDSGTLKSHAITTGLITFDDVDSFGAAVKINDNNLDEAIAYVKANITSGTVAFNFDSTGDGANDSTMLYQYGAVSDTLLELSDVTVLVTTTGATTDGHLHIM